MEELKRATDCLGVAGSATGVYVHRGCRMPRYHGIYFHADCCLGTVYRRVSYSDGDG